ncbi:MAG: DegV family protein [Lachnospiraceae bacterium]|nr:DegV family protein [Lachnospiraceae bacterium]
MKKVTIITDSTSDLSKELLERYQIGRFSLHVHLGEKSYLDGVDITPDEIYAWSDANEATPKTSTPSPAEAIETLEKYLEEDNEIICFCLSAQMSGCMNVMRLAAESLEAEDRIFVVDSKNLSTGIGLQIIEAAILAQQGMSAAEIVEKITALQPKVRASFVVDTLTYLHRGGRCSGVAALAGSVLKLHPSIVVEDGAMHPSKKYRGKMERVILEYVKDMTPALLNAKKDRVFLTHSGCDQAVIDAVKEQLEALNYFEEILITRAGCVITSHCGPGTLGVLFIEN